MKHNGDMYETDLIALVFWSASGTLLAYCDFHLLSLVNNIFLTVSRPGLSIALTSAYGLWEAYLMRRQPILNWSTLQHRPLQQIPFRYDYFAPNPQYPMRGFSDSGDPERK